MKVVCLPIDTASHTTDVCYIFKSIQTQNQIYNEKWIFVQYITELKLQSSFHLKILQLSSFSHCIIMLESPKEEEKQSWMFKLELYSVDSKQGKCVSLNVCLFFVLFCFLFLDFFFHFSTSVIKVSWKWASKHHFCADPEQLPQSWENSIPKFNLKFPFHPNPYFFKFKNHPQGDITWIILWKISLYYTLVPLSALPPIHSFPVFIPFDIDSR